MKYILLTVLLLPAAVLAETNAPPTTPVEEEVVEEGKSAPVEVLTVEQERDKLLKDIEVLQKKIDTLEKDNVNLKNQMLRQRQRAGMVLKLAVDSNSAAAKVLEAMSKF